MGTLFGSLGYWLCRPFGILLGWFYMFGHDYGIALILFTIFTRVILFPLAIKQQKSMAEMVRMRPKLEVLQKKYAKDKQKLNEATMQLYQEESYSPLSGCLPMVIQLPILWILYAAINQPLSYIVGLNQTVINKVVTLAKLTSSQMSRKEIYAAQFINSHPDKVLGVVPANFLHIHFDFFGLDLSQTPKLALNLLILIPILCYLTTFLSTWLNMKFNSAATAQQGGKGMNFSMLLIMPVFTTWFAFQVPAALGFYWVVTNVFMLLQIVILNKFYNPVKLSEKLEEQSIVRKQNRGITTSVADPDEIEEKKPGSKQNLGVAAPRKTSGKMSKKELKQENRRRLAASRAAEQHRHQS